MKIKGCDMWGLEIEPSMWFNGKLLYKWRISKSSICIREISNNKLNERKIKLTL